MTNDIRKAINAVNGKTKLAEASTTLGSVTVTADDTMLRILDLAGIARPSAPDSTMGDRHGSVDNLPVPMDDLGGMQTPAEMPSTVDPLPGLGDTMDAGADLGSEIDVEPELNTEPGADEIDTDPTMISQNGEDSVFEPVDADFDDSENMEIDFEVDPDTKKVPAVAEAEKQAPAKRYDHGNLDANMGQQPYRMDAHNFSGSAKKPVRFVPARSGDNPLVDPKKGLKAYMEDIETERNAVLEDDAASNLMVKTLQGIKNPADQKNMLDTLTDLEKDDSMDKLDPATKLSVAARSTGNAQLSRLVNRELNKPDVKNDLKKLETTDLDDEFLADEDLEERRRNYSFKQTIMPFQGLTGAQRISRAATKAAKRRLG